MLKVNRLTKPFMLLLFSLSLAGCTAQTEAQKVFGSDADYFIGLHLLSEGDEKAAREKFNRCIKKGTYLCAKKSAEALCYFGNIQEKKGALSPFSATVPQGLSSCRRANRPSKKSLRLAGSDSCDSVNFSALSE